MEAKKKFLVKGIVFEVEKLANKDMKVWINGVYVCTLLNSILNCGEWMTTVQYIENLWGSYCGIAFYYEEENVNYSALLEIGAYISSKQRQKLNLPPKYFRVWDRSCEKVELSSNGGDYSFWRNYYPCENGYELHYCTSSDISYCSICGNWHYEGDCRNEKHQIVKVLPENAYPIW
jgi:hypothetical protein